MDLNAHLTRQAAFSRATFGPGPRTKGVCDHIRKELVEVEAFYAEPVPPGGHGPDDHAYAAEEWVDVAILALDGLTRALWAAHPDRPAEWIAGLAATMIVRKQGKNELRDWPDWRKASPDKAIEHVRGTHD